MKYRYDCARRVFDVIDASSRRDIAVLTGLCEADLRGALAMLQQSGVIRKRQGLDISGNRVDYFEPTGAPLPQPETLEPVTARPSQDFDALSATRAGAWY